MKKFAQVFQIVLAFDFMTIENQDIFTLGYRKFSENYYNLLLWMRTYFKRNCSGVPKIFDIWIKRAFAMMYGVKIEASQKK